MKLLNISEVPPQNMPNRVSRTVLWECINVQSTFLQLWAGAGSRYRWFADTGSLIVGYGSTLENQWEGHVRPKWGHMYIYIYVHTYTNSYRMYIHTIYTPNTYHIHLLYTFTILGLYVCICMYAYLFLYSLTRTIYI